MLSLIHNSASKDQSIIAIEKEQDIYKNKKIEMIDLESGKKQNFTCNSDKRIRAVGFLSNDFIYGEADAADVSRSRNGTVSYTHLWKISLHKQQ